MVEIIVWQTRNRWKKGGSLFLFSILCYGFIRFFTEIVVDPASNSFASSLFLGLNLVQWMVVAGFIPGFMLLVFRELMSPGHPVRVAYPVRVGHPVRVPDTQ